MYQNKKRAITLIELLVCIGIMVVTLSLGVTFLKFQSPNINLHGETQKVRATLQRARNLTLTYQITYGVIFFQETGTYQLICYNPNQTILETFTLAPGITFSALGPFTNNTVTFNTAGAVSQAGSVILTNTNNISKSVIINPSGYISAQ